LQPELLRLKQIEFKKYRCKWLMFENRTNLTP
jgi:hypothetical protein